MISAILLALTLLQAQEAEETRIDIDVKEADVLDMLRLFAEIGDFDLVADPDVSCHVTLKLQSVPWPQVLEIVIQTCRLAEDRIGDNLVRVATAEQIRREYEERRKYEEEKRLAGPLVTTYKKLAYGRARDLAQVMGEILVAARLRHVRRAHQYPNYCGCRTLDGQGTRPSIPRCFCLPAHRRQNP